MISASSVIYTALASSKGNCRPNLLMEVEIHGNMEKISYLHQIGKHTDGLCVTCNKPETVSHFLIKCLKNVCLAVHAECSKCNTGRRPVPGVGLAGCGHSEIARVRAYYLYCMCLAPLTSVQMLTVTKIWLSRSTERPVLSDNCYNGKEILYSGVLGR